MRRQFGHSCVGLQTGDVSLNAEGKVVIMTTEILRNILFRDAAETAGEQKLNAPDPDEKNLLKLQGFCSVLEVY